MTRLPSGAVIDLATIPRQELEWIAATALTALEARYGAAEASVAPLQISSRSVCPEGAHCGGRSLGRPHAAESQGEGHSRA